MRTAGSLRLRSGQALVRLRRTRNDNPNHDKAHNDGLGEGAELGAPDALLSVEGGEHHGLVVNAGGVEIDGGSGLGAEVAVAGVEVECADVVRAAGTGKLHAALDASDGVVSLHKSSVVHWRESSAHVRRAAKVMSG